MTRYRDVVRWGILSIVFGCTAGLQAAAPDFSVTSGDQVFRLADARGKYVAVHFLLKTECPYCQRYVADTVRRAPEVAGVTHVFLKPDSDDEVKTWTEKLKRGGVNATIYRDADAKIADAYKIPDGYAFHGQTVHYPAVVLIGPDGAEVFRHVGKDNSDRLPFDQLAAQVARHSRNGAIGEYNLTEGKLALAGYDPVTYVEGRKAQAGKREWSSQYRGAVYQFEGEANRRKFADAPEKYVPAYGGWCATAMAEGRKVEVDPGNFKVTDGRLFLFYKGWLGDAQKDWNKDEKNLTVRANEQWGKVAPADAKKGK